MNLNYNPCKIKFSSSSSLSLSLSLSHQTDRQHGIQVTCNQARGPDAVCAYTVEKAASKK